MIKGFTEKGRIVLESHHQHLIVENFDQILYSLDYSIHNVYDLCAQCDQCAQSNCDFKILSGKQESLISAWISIISQ